MKEDDRLLVLENSLKDFTTVFYVEELIARERTPFQLVELYRLKGFGISLFLDGVLQSTELDEYIYHEAIVHPALFAHPSPKKVFIGGGGECATLREVLRHSEVEYVKMKEIDERLFELIKEKASNFSSECYNDKRVDLKFEDVRSIVEENIKYDVIIFDLCDPDDENTEKGYYSQSFIKSLKKKIGTNGILSLQAGSLYFHNQKYLRKIYKNLKQVFDNVIMFEIFPPSFQAPWVICIASDSEELLKPKRTDIPNLKFYSTDFHPHLLSNLSTVQYGLVYGEAE
uniref:Polyamine aminopropyltransferase n=1 Tax=candidate division WOR-3 bacterium TaxID=2052148 RepID=A0A7C3UNG1_UNCW3